MTTQALSGLSGAFYLDDPKVPSSEFNRIELASNNDRVNYQAPWGLRYWDSSQAWVIEKLASGSEQWEVVVPDEVRPIQGKVCFRTPLKEGDRVRATGKRRDDTKFIKVFNLYNGVLTWDQKVIDVTSSESEGWEECLAGTGSFSFTADTYFYYDETSAPHLDLRDSRARILAKLYSYPDKKVAWIGFGSVVGNDLTLVNTNQAQTKKITFKGNGELYPEMGR